VATGNHTHSPEEFRDQYVPIGFPGTINNEDYRPQDGGGIYDLPQDVTPRKRQIDFERMESKVRS
jgi:hypothetical protein